jgi:hypothetical protein
VKAVLTVAHDVFISHSHEDKPAADAACAALEARGIRCWIAPRDIAPGQDWAASIVAAIQGAQIMLLVFSEHANQSPQVQREVERAASSGKVILPLRVDDVLPEAALAYYLGTPHWLDAITKPFEAHLEKLADACASLLAVTGRSPQDATSDPAPVIAAPATAQPEPPSRDSVSTPAETHPADLRSPAMRWWRQQRRQVQLALIAATVAILAAATGITGYLLRPDSPASHTTTAQPAPAAAPTSSTPPPVPLVTADALEGLLLSPDQINTAMGTSGMTVQQPWNNLNDVGFDSPASPSVCNPLAGAAEAAAYTGSGWAAVRGQTLQEPARNYTHEVDQGVVLFPSPQAAAAFVSASSQSWPACANRNYTDNVRNLQWSVGPVSTANGTVSATTTDQNKSGWACQRALTARNNVVIDATGCGYHTTEQGVSIAVQIAAKVPQ